MQSSTPCVAVQATLAASPSVRVKMDPESGPWQATPVPPAAARGSLPLAAARGSMPLYASLKLSGSVDPYLSSEPHHWRQLKPGSVEFQSPGALTDTHLFATGVLEIFQDLSSYCRQWESCQPSTSMGNAVSTSSSVSEGELNTPEIGAVNGFQFIGSADDNINHLGDDFCPEVLDAFLNSAEDVDVMEDEQTRIDNVVGLGSPNHDLGLVEHEEVVGEYEELPDPLSCSVKCESASDNASLVSGDETIAEELCIDSKLSVDMGHGDIQLNELSCFKDLPVFLPEQTETVAKPKLDLSLVLESVLPSNEVIGTPEVLQLLCDADVNYGWLTCQSDSTAGLEVQPSVIAEQQIAEEPSVVLEETNKVKSTWTRSETISKPAGKVSRKRKGTAEYSSVSNADTAPSSPVPTKRVRRGREVADSGRRPSAEPRQSTVGKRPRSSVSISNEEDICQKYRELRDRNNEASRRSRLNRKTQDEEMKNTAEHLEKENDRLRIKVEELEKLRDKAKEALLRVVKGNRS